ncbi:MAG: tetratricopeptide repeat protein [Bryobacteraceae bacterium]
MRLARPAAVLLSGLMLLWSQDLDLARSIDSIQAAIENNDQDGALRLLAEAMAQYPKQAGLLNLRGVIHAQRHELPDARTDFQQAVRLAPDLTPAWRNLGRACQLLTDTDSTAESCASTAWQRVSRLQPGDAEAHSALATLYEWHGKFADSLQEIEKLPAADAGRSAMLALRCADLEGLRRGAEAAQVARQLVSAPDFSEADIASILPVLESARSAALVVTLVEALDSKGNASLASLSRLAIAYEQLNRLPDARRILERVAVADPNNPAHLMELARIAHVLHDLEGCLGYLAHARDLTPNDARVHFLFGLVTVEMELPLEARKSLQKALEIDPRNPQYNYAMGATLLSAGNAGDAIPYLTRYVKAEPEDSRGHFALGAAYFAASDYDQCRSEMTAISNDPKTEAGATYFLGRVARVAENYDEAQTYLERSIKLLPSFSESYTELAHVHIRQGRYEAASAAIDKALALEPEGFHANSVLLMLYQRTHDPRTEKQAAYLRTLDEKRSKKREMMLRSIELKPF